LSDVEFGDISQSQCYKWLFSSLFYKDCDIVIVQCHSDAIQVSSRCYTYYIW